MARRRLTAMLELIEARRALGMPVPDRRELRRLLAEARQKSGIDASVPAGDRDEEEEQG